MKRLHAVLLFLCFNHSIPGGNPVLNKCACSKIKKNKMVFFFKMSINCSSKTWNLIIMWRCLMRRVTFTYKMYTVANVDFFFVDGDFFTVSLCDVFLSMCVVFVDPINKSSRGMDRPSPSWWTLKKIWTMWSVILETCDTSTRRQGHCRVLGDSWWRPSYLRIWHCPLNLLGGQCFW